VIVIQIMSTILGTSLLEQSSLSFHCHICCFISRSEVGWTSESWPRDGCQQKSHPWQGYSGERRRW